jgi:hypothetical protein
VLVGFRRGRDDERSQARTRREHAVIAGEVEALGRHERREVSDEF